MEAINSKTIVFITGAFVSNSGWDNWITYFERKGYTCYAPPWPYKDAPAAELRRRHPDPRLASLRLSQVVEHYADFVRQLPEKPILIGHSLGGLMTQILVNRDLAVAGVAIHPVPPQGIIPYEFSFLKAGWKALGYFTSAKIPYLMSLKDWQYAFTNGMSLAEQQDSYDKNTIPESKLVARDGLTSAASVDFDKPHVPLLIISGGKDNIMPASINLRNFKKYKRNGSVLDYKEFPDDNHFVLGLPTWQNVADFIADWLSQFAYNPREGTGRQQAAVA